MAAKPAAQKEKAPEESKKKGSVLDGLDKKIHAVAGEVEKIVNQVGGNIARGFAQQALDKIREAVDLLTKAEREDN